MNAALEILINEIKFTYRAGKKTAIIITDAEDNVPKKGNKETLANAQKCKDAGIRLIVVGIVHDKKLVNIKRWKKIASADTDHIKFLKQSGT